MDSSRNETLQAVNEILGGGKEEFAFLFEDELAHVAWIQREGEGQIVTRENINQTNGVACVSNMYIKKLTGVLVTLFTGILFKIVCPV